MSKRPLDSSGNGSATKKIKSDATPSPGPNSSTGLSADELIKQKRAEIAAKMAAMTGKKPNFPAAPAPATNAQSAGIAAPKPTASSSATEDLARRVAEARKRVAEAQNKMSTKDNPYLVAAAQAGKKKATPVEPSPQGAGLKMAAHPLLLDTSSPAPQSKKDKYKPMQPKFASIKANVRNTPTATPPPLAVPSPKPEVKVNPYAAQDAAAGSFEGAAPKERTSRTFRFNQKGKYVAIASQIRNDAQLEALKQRIAESARKAGLDGEFETVEKNIRREAPPEAEWWDMALLPNQNYDDLNAGMAALRIRTGDSPITLYVQHPIKIPAPGDKDKAEIKPLILTKKEQKKMRKQRRQAELQDKRDRIRMGLVPPDPPKVRLANLMKVLTSDAVQDPTRVEARVRREVAMRKHNHEKMNAERKLTDGQRREKLENKKLEEEKKGLVGAVFKVRTLADPSHRFKVRKNAEQTNLTGIIIYHPQFSMVYVEGAAKFIRQYKRLMLNRIKWTEAARARGEEEVEFEDADEGDMTGAGMSSAPKQSAQEDEFGSASLNDNRCDLVWEGELRERAFKTFRPKSCPTDGTAKEALGPKMAGFWDQTKNWKPEEVELF
ncbi:PRP3-domain-containing protein [Fomitiporia mediterranea MF3/22]|uniref:PRP3-domain-containing protein n=1 Tax=Fomitiporia mediterranea (strain MF3/22) TaxID=694068 RepID=UPI00044095AA|nr:PRP3-domain-containing protein [Fomitiporia mediterranea MF3/22]EJD05351.1 PRP3-domain-containing protein [Fomitiporia mediterranea MF3/22]